MVVCGKLDKKTNVLCKYFEGFRINSGYKNIIFASEENSFP